MEKDFERVVATGDVDAICTTADRCGVNALDKSGFTLLMYVVLSSHCGLDAVKALLARGADPNIAEKGQGWTALHFAARDQRAEIVLALIQARANVDSVDVFGNTPLWRSVMSPRASEQTVGVLLEGGANPDFKNRSGMSARNVAQNFGRITLLNLMG